MKCCGSMCICGQGGCAVERRCFTQFPVYLFPFSHFLEFSSFGPLCNFWFSSTTMKMVRTRVALVYMPLTLHRPPRTPSGVLSPLVTPSPIPHASHAATLPPTTLLCISWTPPPPHTHSRGMLQVSGGPKEVWQIVFSLAMVHNHLGEYCCLSAAQVVHGTKGGGIIWKVSKLMWTNSKALPPTK